MNLTMLQLIAAGAFADTTDGQKLVARFRIAVDAGEVPDAEDMRRIAGALSVFLEPSGTTEERAAKVAKRLGVTKKQGRQPRAYAHLSRYGRSVLEYEDLLAETGDAAAAQRAICAKHGIAPRTLRDRIKEYGPQVPILRKLDALTEHALAVVKRK